MSRSVPALASLQSAPRTVRRGVLPLMLGISATLFYLAMAPAVVNGDGLGYLKASVYGGRYPAHPIYLPLLHGLRLLFQSGPRPADALVLARFVSAVSGGLAVTLLGAAVARLAESAESATIATCGFAVSFGVVGAASDVESYAPAMAGLCLALYGLVLARKFDRFGPALAATGAALALLFHLENLLFVPVTLLTLRGRQRLVASVLFALVGLAVLGGMLQFGRELLPAASHGFSYPLSIVTPGIALYGAAKALVFSPYLYEAPRWEVIRDSAVGMAALLTLLFFVTRSRGALPLSRSAIVVWVAGYTAVGVAFFASDAERWLFLLPLLWLIAGVRLRATALLPLVAVLLLANLLIYRPRAYDDRFLRRAAAAARHLRPGDLVVSPGHGWDEYIGFEQGPEVENLPLVYFAGQLGTRERLMDELAHRIELAHHQGRRICTARLADRADPLGWKELRPFGITTDNVESLLPAHREEQLGDEVSCLSFLALHAAP